MYVELIYNNHPEEAKQLMEKFRGNLEKYYQDDLRRFIPCYKTRTSGKKLINWYFFKSIYNQFIIRMSKDNLSVIKRHLPEKRYSVLLNIIQEHLYFDMYEGVARNKQQIDAISGATIGKAIMIVENRLCQNIRRFIKSFY